MNRFGVWILVLLIAAVDFGYVRPGLAQMDGLDDEFPPVAIGGATGRSVRYNVWLARWTWTAPATGSVTFDTEGSDFATFLTVRLGSVEVVGSSDGLTVHEVQFTAQRGQLYHIDATRNDGISFDPGTIVLNWQTSSSDGGGRVRGDDFAASVAIDGASGRSEGSNVGAGRESGEPDHAGNSGGASVWWTWTAATTGPVTFDTHGSNFDTLLAVYTGDALGSLAETASNDDDDGTYQSAVQFSAQQGRTYHIAVDGWGGESGTIVLNWQDDPAGRDVTLQVSDLKVSVFGAGSLRVVSGGDPLDCAAVTICQGAFETGSEIVIEASPDSDWAHERWVGCDQDSGGQCTVFMDGDRFVSVAFRSTKPLEVENHVVQLQADQLEDLVEYDVANGVLVFEADTIGLSQWAIGDILLSGGNSTGSDDRSRPFARRILDIVDAPDSLTNIHTIQASLDDIFRSGSLSYRQQGEAVTVSAGPPLPGGSRGSQGRAPNSVVVSPSGDPFFPNDLTVDLTFKNTDGEDIVTVTGTIGLSVEPELDVHFSPFSPLEARLVVHARTKGSLSLDLGGVELYRPAPKELPFRLRLPPIPAGPIAITPEVKLFLIVSVNVSNPIKPTVTYGISTTAGAHYKSGHGIKPIFSFDGEVDATLRNPETSLVLSVEAGVRGEIQLKIYGVLGPTLGFGPYVGVRKGRHCRQADIYAGARLTVGGEAKIFGYGLRFDVPAWESQRVLGQISYGSDGVDLSHGTPTGLRVADTGIDSVTLEWNAPQDDCGLAGYNVYRGGRSIAEGVLATTYTEGGLVPDRQYCYEVSAKRRAGGETVSTGEMCGSTEGPETELPESPVNVAAEALSSSAISVTWDAPTDAGGIASYVVFQHSGPDVFPVDSVAVATPEIEVGGLQPDAEYCFSVRSVSAGGTSDHSTMTCSSTLDESAATITLTWGEEPRDLASHLYGPDGQGGVFHVYWRDQNVLVGETPINHDVDDTNGYGPEVITIPRFPFPAGTYHYLAEHWAGSSTISASPARVELNLDGKNYIFSAEMASGSDEGQGSVWAVFKIEVDQNFMIEVIPVQEFQSRLLDSDTPS